ncbi:15193_t:CDS:1, partial [Cetraspora pellucida]
ILDDTLLLFTNMSVKFCNIFKNSVEQFQISINKILKQTCKIFVQKEKKKNMSRSFKKFDNALFDEFFDRPERLQKLTQQILE